MTTIQMSIKTLLAWYNSISRLNALVERSSKFVYSTQRLSNYPLSSVRRDYTARGWQQSFRQCRLCVLYMMWFYTQNILYKYPRIILLNLQFHLFIKIPRFLIQWLFSLKSKDFIQVYIHHEKDTIIIT